MCLNLARAIIMAALHKLLSSTGMVCGEVRGVTPRLYPTLSWGDVSHDAFPEQLSSAAGSDQRWQEYHIWLSLAFFICAIVFHRTDIHAAVQNPSLSLIPPPPPHRLAAHIWVCSCTTLRPLPTVDFIPTFTQKKKKKKKTAKKTAERDPRRFHAALLEQSNI